MKVQIGILITALAGILFFGGCKSEDNYYLAGLDTQTDELELLFGLLEDPANTRETVFMINKRISGILYSSGGKEKQNLFLTDYVEKNPDDSFNAYYLLTVARNYLEAGAQPIAVYYFERILNNYPDLLVEGKSIHLACLTELIKLIEQPEIRVAYYKELIARFYQDIDVGLMYYYIGKNYEKIGEWNLAIQSYQRYLNYSDVEVPDQPEAGKETQSLIDFYYSDKSWTYSSLENLANAVKYALYTRNGDSLDYLMAKVNFFAMSWDKDEEQPWDEFYDLSSFLKKRKIVYSLNLDPKSNDQEAYLRTEGWDYKIRIWYFYFRKIHFPADPEINGRWEWAGIYLGDKL